jgi:hypothetical protein
MRPEGMAVQDGLKGKTENLNIRYIAISRMPEWGISLHCFMGQVLDLMLFP